MTTLYYIKDKQVNYSEYNFNLIFEDYITTPQEIGDIIRFAAFIENKKFSIKNLELLDGSIVLVSNNVNIKIEYTDKLKNSFIKNYTLPFEEIIKLPFKAQDEDVYLEVKTIKLNCRKFNNYFYFSIFYKIYVHIY